MLQVDIAPELAAAVRALVPELRTAVSDAVERAMRNRLLTVPEAAEVLGMSPAAVRKRVARGSLKCVRYGRSVRVRMNDLFDGEGAPVL